MDDSNEAPHKCFAPPWLKEKNITAETQSLEVFLFFFHQSFCNHKPCEEATTTEATAGRSKSAVQKKGSFWVFVKPWLHNPISTISGVQNRVKMNSQPFHPHQPTVVCYSCLQATVWGKVSSGLHARASAWSRRCHFQTALLHMRRLDDTGSRINPLLLLTHLFLNTTLYTLNRV